MAEPRTTGSLAAQVRTAVIWRSGSQIGTQIVSWASTLIVIRLLAPQDYGLFAMAQVMLVLLNTMNGYGLASALIREEEVTEERLRQTLGMLMLLNGGLALVQFLQHGRCADRTGGVASTGVGRQPQCNALLGTRDRRLQRRGRRSPDRSRKVGQLTTDQPVQATEHRVGMVGSATNQRPHPADQADFLGRLLGQGAVATGPRLSQAATNRWRACRIARRRST